MACSCIHTSSKSLAILNATHGLWTRPARPASQACFTTVTPTLRQNIILPVTELWTWLQAGDGLLQLKRWAESYLEDILNLRVLQTPRCCPSQRQCCKQPRHRIKQCARVAPAFCRWIFYRQTFQSSITKEVSPWWHLEAPSLPKGVCSFESS